MSFWPIQKGILVHEMSSRHLYLRFALWQLFRPSDKISQDWADNKQAIRFHHFPKSKHWNHVLLNQQASTCEWVLDEERKLCCINCIFISFIRVWMNPIPFPHQCINIQFEHPNISHTRLRHNSTLDTSEKGNADGRGGLRAAWLIPDGSRAAESERLITQTRRTDRRIRNRYPHLSSTWAWPGEGELPPKNYFTLDWEAA